MLTEAEGTPSSSASLQASLLHMQDRKQSAKDVQPLAKSGTRLAEEFVQQCERKQELQEEVIAGIQEQHERQLRQARTWVYLEMGAASQQPAYATLDLAADCKQCADAWWMRFVPSLCAS